MLLRTLPRTFRHCQKCLEILQNNYLIAYFASNIIIDLERESICMIHEFRVSNSIIKFVVLKCPRIYVDPRLCDTRVGQFYLLVILINISTFYRAVHWAESIGVWICRFFKIDASMPVQLFPATWNVANHTASHGRLWRDVATVHTAFPVHAAHVPVNFTQVMSFSPQKSHNTSLLFTSWRQ